MKVVGTGKTYRIYEDDLKTYDKLPIGTFIVRFSNISGFHLDRCHDFECSEKVYGEQLRKRPRIWKGYERMDRSLGVILSGVKGIGKSMFAQLLIEDGYSKNLPVIIVKNNYKGIDSFLDEIDQECIVLFDEFEKVFDKYPDGDVCSQSDLLSLFDGLSKQKKMYVITCNNLDQLSEYIINRTGRFHYHIRFDYPNSLEIKEYLEDNIDEEYYSEIAEVSKFAIKVPLTYDTLRSIAFELSLGYKFKEFINDLNIKRNHDPNYKINVFYETSKEKNKILTLEKSVDLFEDNISIWCGFNGERISFDFDKSSLKYGKDSFMYVEDQDIRISCDDPDEMDLNVKKITLEVKRTMSDNLNFF